MSSIFELPLFPLNTVLFPGMPLTLHIFEERYKQMVGLCLQQQRPFGVVLIREGVAEQGPLPEPHAVGCTAHIAQAQPLVEGRMYLMTIGQERFRIVSLRHDRPYLVGMVELAPLADESVVVLQRTADRLYPLVVDYLTILARLGSVEFDMNQIPTEPESLVYLAASILQVPTEQKQHFLATDKASHLLRDLRIAYREEIALLRLLPNEDLDAFSLN